MNKIRDGDLYKVVNVFGRIFHLFYGYYDEQDKYGKYREPVPIYPNFIEHPEYTDNGYPFATEMQDICPHYQGKRGEDSCFACSHFRKGDEMIGICLCEARINAEEPEKAKITN